MYSVYLVRGKLNYSRMVLTILKKWLDCGIDLEKLRSRAIVRFYLVFYQLSLVERFRDFVIKLSAEDFYSKF